MLREERSRLLVIIAIVIAAIVASLTAAWVMSRDGANSTSSNQGTPSVSASPPLSVSPAPSALPATTAWKGIATGDMGDALGGRITQEGLRQYMALAKAQNVKLIRSDIGWSGIQENHGDPFDFTQYRWLVDIAAQHDIRVQGILTAPPAYAVRADCPKAEDGSPQPWRCAPEPAFLPAWDAYVKATATEFIGQIDTYEVLNEASSLPDYFKNVGRYVELLKRTRGVIHEVYRVYNEAHPGATLAVPRVLPSATADIGTSDLDGEGLNPVDWYKTMMANGAKGLMDAANMHPYPGPRSPKAGVGGWSFIDEVHRITGLPIEITEIGFATGGEHAVTEAQQERYLSDLFELVDKLHRDGKVVRVFLFSLRDLPSGGLYFGILHADGTPKQAAQKASDWVLAA